MQLPGPVRAVIGLVAVAADEAKRLPDRAVELPMLAVSSALQASLRAQQRYARLAARGDDVIHRRPPGDEPPPWATFDEPVPPVSVDELRRAAAGGPDAADHARAASQLLDDLLGASEGSAPRGEHGRSAPAKATARATAKKPAAKKPPAAAGSKAPATSTAKKQPAKKSGTQRRSVKDSPNDAGNASGDAAGKTINAPRHASPSRFDTVPNE